MNNLSRARRPVRDRTAPDRFNPSEETANSKERGRRAKEVANSKERGRQTPSHFKEGREPQRVKAKRSKYRLHRKNVVTPVLQVVTRDVRAIRCGCML